MVQGSWSGYCAVVVGGCRRMMMSISVAVRVMVRGYFAGPVAVV